MPQIIISISEIEDIDYFSNADAFLIGNRKTTIRYEKDISFSKMVTYIEKAHQENKKIYLDITKIYLQNEIKQLKEDFKIISSMNFDGLFFSDFSILTLASEYQITDKLFYASDTQIVNYHDLNVLSEYGVLKAIVSKEMPLDNILQSLTNSSLQLGMLVFGHYRMFYSKRKLIESYLRKNNIENIDFLNSTDMHVKEKTRDEKLPILQNENGTLIFSHDVMFALEEASMLVENGLKYCFFDSLLLKKDIVKLAISTFKENFKDTIHTRKEFKEKSGLVSISTGFLNKKIGAR